MYTTELYKVDYDFASIQRSFAYDTSQTHEQNRAELMKAFDVVRLTDSQIRKMGSKGLNQFSLSAAKWSPEEQPEAIRINKLAQQTMADEIISINAAIARLEEIVGKGSTDALRRELVYIRRDDTSEALQFNQALLKACQNNDNKELARLQFEGIEYAQKQLGIQSEKDIYRLGQLEGEELLKNYQLISHYGRMLQDSDRILENPEFTEQQRQTITQYKGLTQDLISTTSEKLNLMANPLWADLNPNYLFGKQANTFAMGTVLSQLQTRGRYPVDREKNYLINFVDRLNIMCVANGMRAIENLSFKHPELADATLSKNPETALGEFMPVVAQTKDGREMVLINGLPPKMQSAESYTKALQEMAIEADRYLLTGSKQYDNMLKALADFNLAREQQADAAEMTSKTAALAEAAEKYLIHKNLDAPYNVKSILDRGSKNQREQSRMETASFLYHYATARQSVETKMVQEKKSAAESELQQEIDEVKQVNTSQMTAEKFKEHLEAVYAKDPGRHIITTMSKETCTPRDYYKAVSEVLEAQVADKMLTTVKEFEEAGTPEKGVQFLEEQKHIYTSLAVGLRKFVREKSDAELVKAVCNEHKVGSNNYIKLMIESGRLERNGVAEYLDNITKENELNKQGQMQQLNPSQAQMDQAQMQMAQSQVSQSQPQPQPQSQSTQQIR